MKRRVLLLVILLAFAGLGGVYLQQSRAQRQDNTSAAANRVAKDRPAGTDENAFDTSRHPLDVASSLWAVVNKARPLKPATYVPQPLVVPGVTLRTNISANERQLRLEAADALQKLFAAAANEGITLNLQSGYRSYHFQEALYGRYVREQGQAVADTQSARPGHSEHQTGLAADVGGVTQPACNVEQCFADTAEGKWVITNAYKHGFILRYPANKMPTTGYTYEPWHLRYVGIELSQQMHKKRIATLEEFFGLPAAPDYH